MTVTLIGCGCGTDSLTAAARAAIDAAPLLIGAFTPVRACSCPS